MSKATIIAQPSVLESWLRIGLQNALVLAFGVAVAFGFQQLSTETARLY
ncbi:hypothetical protein [Comamonas sp.]|nr:hypothetical protein [Comamonas sp.]